MVKEWLDSLVAAGFDVDLESTGDARVDAQRVATETVIAPLAHLGLIQAHGDDALPFLHNLLTNDVSGLGESDLRRAGFCTPKGRMLADFLIWRDNSGVMLQLSADLLPPILKKLSMYVLRSKVKLSDASNTLARIGLAGPQAVALLQQQGLPQPAPMQQQAFADGFVLGLGEQRFEIVVAVEKAGELWLALSASAQPAGMPLITAPIVAAFVPQMVNYELIGGVSFKKGCYPGQEIVARTHYLGKVKRRMYRAHIDAESLIAGTSVYSPETGDQACGTVVSSAPAAQGGVDLLFSAQSSCVAAGEIHFGNLAGPLAQILTLPYPVE